MSVRISGILCVTASALALAYVPPAVAQQGDQPAASGSEGLEEIVVTARRREEKLQSVPIAVTAFTGEAIEDKRIEALGQLQFQTPSLAFRNVSSRDQDDIVELRGLPGVITYLNEVPLGGSAGAGVGGASGGGGGAGPGVFYDLESIQVLNGPQGTLFGRNTTGGAILITSKKPTNNFEGYAQIQLGNYNDHEFEGAINVPVIPDKLLVRFATSVAMRDGFTKLLTGPAAGTELDSRDYWAGRLSVTMRPTDDFQNDVLAYSNYKHETGTSTVMLYANPKVLSAALYAQAQAIIAQQNALGKGSVVGSSIADPLDKGWNRGVFDTAKWDITDNLSLKNIAAYLQNSVEDNHELDGTSLAILAQFNHFGWVADTSQMSEELQFNGKLLDDKLNWTVGGFLLFVHPAKQPGLPSQQTTISGGTIRSQSTFLNTTERSQALFAQFDYDLSGISDVLEGFKLTAGYRYTWDWRSVGQGSLVTVGGATICTQTGADANCVVAQDAAFHAPTWTAGLDYQITPDTLLYATGSRGYQSGGFNLLSPVASAKKYLPEYLTDVEVGVKSDWELYGIKARTNLDWYYGWYKNVQKSRAVVLNGVTVTVFDNNTQAHVTGLEAMFTVIPVDGLEITGNYSYNESVYDNYVVGVGAAAVQYKGNEFLYTPKNKYSVTGKYTLPIDASLGKISVMATYNWQGHEYFGLDNLPFATYGDVKTVDISINWNNVLNQPFDLNFFMNNALDATYATGIYELNTTSGFSSVIYGEPRMYGVKLRYRFEPETESAAASTATYTPPPVQPPVAAPAVPKSYLVFFDFDKSDLTPQATQIVDQAARNAQTAKVTRIDVTGHTDTVGSDAYNLRLSQRRAQSVASAMEARGIPASEIAIFAKGKRDLLVPTADGVREPQNRRVEIVYSGGGPTS